MERGTCGGSARGGTGWNRVVEQGGTGGRGCHLGAAELEAARRSEGVGVHDLLAERPAHAAVDGVRLVDDGVGHRRVQRKHLHDVIASSRQQAAGASAREGREGGRWAGGGMGLPCRAVFR
jgi:hypothetical protein